jgi:hypothetical protein
MARSVLRAHDATRLKRSMAPVVPKQTTKKTEKGKERRRDARDA